MEVVFAGLVGALGVFVLTTLRDWLAGWWRREVERAGLLRLVTAEIATHKVFALEVHLSREPGEYVNDPGLARSPGRPLGRDAWDQARVRLAQLLPSHRFADLAAYYANVQQFNYLLDAYTSPRDRGTVLKTAAGGLSEDGTAVREWIREEYVGKVPPDSSRPPRLRSAKSFTKKIWRRAAPRRGGR